MKKVLSLIATSLIWGSLSVFSQKAIEFQFDDGSQHRVLTNNIESILFESTGDNQYKQIINTHAFVFESSVKASDRVRLTNVEWPEAISYTKDIGEWDEIICYRDGSMMGLKYRSGSDEFKDLILISPTDTLFCHVIFDEDGMPKKIFINDGYYYVNSYTDTSINLTLVVGDSLVCPLGDVPVDLSAESRPATRGWSQMGTKSRLLAVFKAITGITVATTSVAAGVATITAGSTVVGTIAVVGLTGYSIFSGGQLVWGSIKRAFDIGSKPEDSSIVSEIAQEVAENTVEKVVETATEQKTWNLWKVIKDKKGEVLKKAPKAIASFAVDILSDIFIDDLEDTGDKEDLLKEMYNVGGLGISGLSIDNFFAMAHKAKIKGIINPQLLKLHGVWQDVKFYIHIPEGYGGPREILISEDQIDANGKFECVIDNLQPDTEYYCGIVYYNKTHGPSMSVYEHFTTMTLTTGNAVQDKTTPQNYTVSGNVKQSDNLKGLRECSMGIRYTQYKEELDDMSSAVLSKDVPLKDGDFTVKLTGLDTQKTYYYCTYVYSPNTFDYDRGEIRTIAPDKLCPDENHPHAIDLGLPSGKKWSCCNVGASKPTEYGSYYYWKEAMGTGTLPSQADYEELFHSCSKKLVTIDGVNGVLYSASNGNSIFFPFAGYFGSGSKQSDGNGGVYWTSSTYDLGVPDLPEIGLKCAYYVMFEAEMFSIDEVDQPIFENSVRTLK